MGKDSAVKMQRAGNVSGKSSGKYQSIASNDGESDEEVGNVIQEKAIEMVSKQSSAPNGEELVGKEADGEGDGADDDDEEELEISYNSCILWLVIITLLIAVLSEAISDTIEKAAQSAGISAIFISAIILPIVGNAAEHAGAVLFAMKGKLDLALGVAMGSSTQIALCVLPFLVLLAWAFNLNLDLNFGAYETLTLFLATICVTFGIKDGVSTWMTGLIFVASYLIISVGFLFHKDESLSS
jgi:Ca2+:H+ antiporter